MFLREGAPHTMIIKNDHPIYPLREEPEGSYQRGGTFNLIIHTIK